MSRSGYTDGCDNWDSIRWRGAVASAIRGKRGQAFLREMLVALDALPEPKLIEGDLIDGEGCCAMGAVALKRSLEVGRVDPHDPEQVARLFGIAGAMAAEIAFVNDDEWRKRSEEARFRDVRSWVVSKIAEEKETATDG